MILICILIALLLDLILKEPRCFHPLVGFGYIADSLEQQLNKPNSNKTNGIIAWCLAVLPLTCLAAWLESNLVKYPIIHYLFAAIILYLGIGWQSLLSHAKSIIYPLLEGDCQQAQQAVSRIVSRDTATMEQSEIAAAATESILENGADAVFSTIFWFCILGVSGVVLYRLSNTLDAMWGYKNQRYLQFGWLAARIDDVLNYIPARLTALSYALTGNTKAALQAWQQQAGIWKSPNAGVVMATGAGAINLILGGDAIYNGQLQQRPALGLESGDKPKAISIAKACSLINRTLLLWLLIIGIVVLIGKTV